MAKLPIEFRKSSDTLVTVDFVDAFSGVGYVKLWLCGGSNTGGNTYFLTTDSRIRADFGNYLINGTSDHNFDLTITRPITVADGNAIVDSAIYVDTGVTAAVTWNIYHVSQSGTETLIGSTVGNSVAGSSGNEQFIKTTLVAVTKTKFKPGEKLRINPVTSGANEGYFIDPSGTLTESNESPAYPLSTSVLIPVEVPQ